MRFLRWHPFTYMYMHTLQTHYLFHVAAKHGYLRPWQWDYLFLITRSLVQARGRAVVIIVHYCGFSGSSANSNSPSLGSSNVRENLRTAIVSKWHSKDLPQQQHLPNTLTNNCCTQIHHFMLQGSSSRWRWVQKNSTTLKREPGGNNEVNDVNRAGVPDRRGREMRNK